MKRIIVIGLACLLALGACVNCFAKDMKIGFADKMKILFDYDKTKALNKELEDESQAARGEIDKKSAEIRKMNDEMSLLSESAKQEKQPELEAKVKALDDFRRAKMQELSRKQDEGVRAITAEIADVAAKFGKEKGYDVIIDIRATLYAPEGEDVTDDILAELNKK